MEKCVDCDNWRTVDSVGQCHECWAITREIEPERAARATAPNIYGFRGFHVPRD